MKLLSLIEANAATVWCVITAIAWDESRVVIHVQILDAATLGQFTVSEPISQDGTRWLIFSPDPRLLYV